MLFRSCQSLLHHLSLSIPLDIFTFNTVINSFGHLNTLDYALNVVLSLVLLVFYVKKLRWSLQNESYSSFRVGSFYKNSPSQSMIDHNRPHSCRERPHWFLSRQPEVISISHCIDHPKHYSTGQEFETILV